ncbi:hypothetical protein M3P05_09415 [Sansalvadorimonas sp. 2012CJ34-2]|uniref:Uncharacterized protein n=1 Tax=Parendozoicomonas callyspongiae TaxID=2942213 RepID=A0ABT0PFK8_9GAMM|nr:hypothetical protein [Sansalvadorimonas sp. 2012CJ34-2]MCL6270150.1 hypothetical protein [Sansalvadorimonas sp. 2012CJ34-2]
MSDFLTNEIRKRASPAQREKLDHGLCAGQESSGFMKISLDMSQLLRQPTSSMTMALMAAFK